MIYFEFKYIKMCKDERIQNIKIDKDIKLFEPGDYYLNGQTSNVELAITSYRLSYYGKDDYIWIPTNDDLIELLGGQFIDIIKSITTYYDKSADYLVKIDTGKANEVLLAMYMRIKHRLMWDGSKWVKIE